MEESIRVFSLKRFDSHDYVTLPLLRYSARKHPFSCKRTDNGPNAARAASGSSLGF